MPGAARLGDSISGMTSGEHNGHFPPHSPCKISGNISDGCSSNVFINGKPAAFVNSVTTENDCCDSNKKGIVSQGSSTVFINGKHAARINDSLIPHNGSGYISSCSNNVFIGG